MNTKIRKIIHIDMDAFYASVEQRDNPKYRGKPIAVGGSEKRGVVATASYEARKFGVRSAMPSVIAKNHCPDLIFVKPRFDIYKSVSQEIIKILQAYTDFIEATSLDEAYLDVTSNKMGIPFATLIAKEIKKKIKKDLKLTASAGISINKFLAKVASDIDKPDGLYVILPDKASDFIDFLPIEKIPGIGKVTSAKMHKMNIKSGGDLKKYTKIDLVKLYGKIGLYYYDIINCKYHSPVKSNRTRKSVGAENTFSDDLIKEDEMLDQLKKISISVANRLKRTNKKGKTVTLKIRSSDFVTRTRSKTINQPITTANEIFYITKELFFYPEKPQKPIRLFGISISHLESLEEPLQLTLSF
ncbi:DNA polymerase IV [Bacteroidota bacterium]